MIPTAKNMILDFNGGVLMENTWAMIVLGVCIAVVGFIAGQSYGYKSGLIDGVDHTTATFKFVMKQFAVESDETGDDSE